MAVNGNATHPVEAARVTRIVEAVRRARAAQSSASTRVHAAGPLVRPSQPRAVGLSSGKEQRRRVTPPAAATRAERSARVQRIVNAVRAARAKTALGEPVGLGRGPLVTPSQPRAVGLSSGKEARRQGNAGLWSRSVRVDAVTETVETLRELARYSDNAERRSQVRAAIDALPAGSYRQLVVRAPNLVANLNGVPFSLRSQAARLLIEERFASQQRRAAIARERFAIAAINAPNQVRPWYRIAPPMAKVVAEVTRERDALLGIESLRSPFIGPDGTRIPRRFLAYTPPSLLSSGRVIEVFGDLEHATHVLVMVAGMNNHVDRFRSTRIKSEQIARLALEEHPEDKFAVVEWMGYNSPGYVRSITTSPAVRGAADLRAFIDALEVQPGTEVTILGHSYGSVVVSEALRQGLGVHRAVFTGSPGVRVKQVQELGLPSESVFVAANEKDLIVRLKWHGTNPAREPFGAVRLATDGRGHAHYFEADRPGSLTVRNVAHIALGRLDQLVHQTRSARDAAMQPRDNGPALR